jgi:hypothetical protein
MYTTPTVSKRMYQPDEQELENMEQIRVYNRELLMFVFLRQYSKGK